MTSHNNFSVKRGCHSNASWRIFTFSGRNCSCWQQLWLVFYAKQTIRLKKICDELKLWRYWRISTHQQTTKEQCQCKRKCVCFLNIDAVHRYANKSAWHGGKYVSRLAPPCLIGCAARATCITWHSARTVIDFTKSLLLLDTTATPALSNATRNCSAASAAAHLSQWCFLAQHTAAYRKPCRDVNHIKSGDGRRDVHGTPNCLRGLSDRY